MPDTLFLIEPGFRDPAYRDTRPLPEDQAYYWPYCVSLEGILALYPAPLARLRVERVPFTRPRRHLIELVGEANQGLPKLVLDDDASDELANGRHGSVRFVS